MRSKELETGRIKGNSGQTWLVSVLATMAERTVVVRFRASLNWYRCLWVLTGIGHSSFMFLYQNFPGSYLTLLYP